MRFLPCFFAGFLLAGSFPVTADILYSVTDLGTLGGGSFDITVGTGINNAGQVTGLSTKSIYTERAFLYSNGQMTDLGTLGGDFSYGLGLNNSGQVVGSSDTSPGPGPRPSHAFLYSNGQIRDLNDLIDPALGVTLSSASGINNAGQVTGISEVSTGGFHAFLYSNGQMTDLGTLGGYCSVGNGINDVGQVTGFSSYIGDYCCHAFLYSDGQMADLGTLGGLESFGASINDVGQVTGRSTTSTGLEHAFLYSDGQMRDLNDLIDPTLGVTLGEATAINDRGQIVARNAFGTSRTYLLAPVPEPSTLALFGVALLGLGVWARRHPNMFR